MLAVAVCLGALAGDRFVVSPLYAFWNERASAIAGLEESLAKSSLLVGRLDDMAGYWSEMRARSLPPAESRAENEVLSSVTRWAQDSRLEITSLKPKWVHGGTASNTLDIRAAGQGSMEAIALFLYRLESDWLPLRVESLEVAARDDSGSLLTFGLTFTGLQLVGEDS
jgi:hypothetical protein